MRKINITTTNPYTVKPVEPEIPVFTKEEFEDRISRLLNKMSNSELTHVIVYGDREHFSNLEYLTGFDPRYEEGMLIIQ
ncbi:MAG TPA: hypothetical protein PK733_12655, partial [Clostridiales bacterium]|nr:hypothetical protein [Clostridiales bacterium]